MVEHQESAISSVGRALSLLTLLCERGGLGVSEAARLLGLPVSSTHRLLGALEADGFVARGQSSSVYLPGPMVGRLVNGLQAEEDLLCQVSRPYLRHLVDEYSETAHLVVLRGNTVRFVAGCESHRAVRVGLRVGAEYPAHATSAGKMLLALMTPSTLDALYPQEQLTPATATTVATKTELLASLAGIRARGYAVNNGESEPAVVGVGAAIVDLRGRARGGLVVGGPSARLSIDDTNLVGAEVAATARAIGDRL